MYHNTETFTWYGMSVYLILDTRKDKLITLYLQYQLCSLQFPDHKSQLSYMLHGRETKRKNTTMKDDDDERGEESNGEDFCSEMSLASKITGF